MNKYIVIFIAVLAMILPASAQSGTYIVTFLVDGIVSDGDSCPPNIADLYVGYSGSEVDVTFAGNSLTLSHPEWGDLNLSSTNTIDYAGQDDFVSYTVTVSDTQLDGTMTGNIPGCTLTMPFTLSMGMLDIDLTTITTFPDFGAMLLDSFGIEAEPELRNIANCGDLHIATFDEPRTVLPIDSDIFNSLPIASGITSTLSGAGKTSLGFGGLSVDVTPCEDVWDDERYEEEFGMFGLDDEASTWDGELDAIMMLHNQTLITLLNLNSSLVGDIDDEIEIELGDAGIIVGGFAGCDGDDALIIELPDSEPINFNLNNRVGLAGNDAVLVLSNTNEPTGDFLLNLASNSSSLFFVNITGDNAPLDDCLQE